MCSGLRPEGIKNASDSLLAEPRLAAPGRPAISAADKSLCGAAVVSSNALERGDNACSNPAKLCCLAIRISRGFPGRLRNPGPNSAFCQSGGPLQGHRCPSIIGHVDEL